MFRPCARISASSLVSRCEVFGEHRVRLLTLPRLARQGVHPGAGRGRRRRLAVRSAANPVDLKHFVRDFLRSDEKQVLLLSGAAGSGKSTAVAEIELMIETEFRDWRRRANDRDGQGNGDGDGEANSAEVTAALSATRRGADAAKPDQRFIWRGTAPPTVQLARGTDQRAAR